jgi:predicted nucleic acid-binding protein
MKSSIILLDSSCWIEIFRGDKLSHRCQKELQSASVVIVPTVVLFEVYRKINTSISEDQALSCIAVLSQYKNVELTREVALSAADLSIQLKLPMADSLILAHSQNENAILVTLDNDFSKIPGVKIIR